jgi:hypothetical protein
VASADPATTATAPQPAKRRPTWRSDPTLIFEVFMRSNPAPLREKFPVIDRSEARHSAIPRDDRVDGDVGSAGSISTLAQLPESRAA